MVRTMAGSGGQSARYWENRYCVRSIDNGAGRIHDALGMVLLGEHTMIMEEQRLITKQLGYKGPEETLSLWDKETGWTWQSWSVLGIEYSDMFI